jgi:hypothetical protein
MKKLTTLFCAILLAGSFASAAHWWARSFVTVTSNQSLYNYGIVTNVAWTVDNNWTTNTPFDSYDFGVVNSLILNGGYSQGGYNGSDYLDASSFVLYYRVYSTTGTPGSWSSIPITNFFFTQGSVNVIYNNISAGLDVLALVDNAVGSYYLEVILTKTNYWNAQKSPSFTTANGGTAAFALGTSSTGYKAMFNISRIYVSSNVNLSTLAPTAATDVTVLAGYELTITADASVKSITVDPGAKLTLTSGTLTATNGITLESDATGTATLMDSNTEPTITATVKQYVTAGRNWYMSAPLNNTADYTVLDKGASVAEYNEVTGLWPAVTSGTLTRGKGYVQVASATQGTTGTVSFSGITNSGDVPVTLTYTSDKGKGFNLVGNPYPSYLSWSAVVADNAAANMPTGTMWYRTISYNGKSAWEPSKIYNQNDIVYNGTRFYKATSVTGTSAALSGPTGSGTGILDNEVVWNYEGSVYVFATISASGVASPATVSNLVPPMQAFWVKSNGGTLTFKNAMRAHITGGTNALKAPKNSANEMPLLRLSVTNGASADEAVIYATENASNAFDTFDAPKYFNTASNQPEIYTQVGNEKLVINAMNEIITGTEIALGFVTEKGNDFTISATEWKNQSSDMRVVLKDKQLSSEFDLTTGQQYTFSSAVVNNSERFSLIFKAQGNTTAMENANQLIAQVYVNAANQIVIIAPEKATYSIYNAMGQLIENGITNSKLKTHNSKLSSGVYVVNVNNQSTRVIIK